jgi:Protein of unknown function (DUF2817)
MNLVESFSVDYREARSKFLTAAELASAHLESVSHPELGPDGQELFSDVAWLGPSDAQRVLVLISGTHGVEGFCGSGAQVALLRSISTSPLPTGVAVLLIHAINPYGFAWLRRVTHENVDLNRNWLDFSAPIAQNLGYNELHAALCPVVWSEQSVSEGSVAVAAYASREGVAAQLKAVSGGQYSHPTGVMYGGAEPTWSRLTQTTIFEHYLRTASKIAIIDYHTGLGPWGYGERIVTAHTESEEFVRATAWFGGGVTSTSDGSSTSSVINGDGLSAATRLLCHAEVTGVALEFGTQTMDKVLLAICADCWLHRYGDHSTQIGQSIKQQIRNAFYGDTDEWKGMVLGQSYLACRQAISGLLSR